MLSNARWSVFIVAFAKLDQLLLYNCLCRRIYYLQNSRQARAMEPGDYDADWIIGLHHNPQIFIIVENPCRARSIESRKVETSQILTVP